MLLLHLQYYNFIFSIKKEEDISSAMTSVKTILKLFFVSHKCVIFLQNTSDNQPVGE